MHGTGGRHGSLGAYFPDLPSNMLGSFLMGLFAASGTLGIPNSKELAILPESSSWQVASESCFLILLNLFLMDACPLISQGLATRTLMLPFWGMVK